MIICFLFVNNSLLVDYRPSSPHATRFFEICLFLRHSVHLPCFASQLGPRARFRFLLSRPCEKSQNVNTHTVTRERERARAKAKRRTNCCGAKFRPAIEEAMSGEGWAEQTLAQTERHNGNHCEISARSD